MSDRKTILDQLNAKIPRDVVKERSGGGGQSFSYLEGHYVINRLNEVFGQGNWGYRTDEIRCVHAGETNGKLTVHYIATVTLAAHFRDQVGSVATFSDVGYGDGQDKMNIGKAHELAAKEAVTDALKRCAKNLGMSMGLALYSKDQENVDDGEEEQRPAAKSTPKSVPIGKSPQAGTSTHDASMGKPVSEGAVPQNPPSDRAQLNSMLDSMARVLNAKKRKSFGDLKKEMKDRYGVEKKEEMNNEQASEFYRYLAKEMIA